MVSDTRENKKKIKDQSKNRKLLTEEKLANALKKNMKLRSLAVKKADLHK